MGTRKSLVSVAVVGLLTVSGLSLAQFGGGMGRGGGGSGPRAGEMRRPPDPERMRQMMMDRIRETLRAGDEEWKVLEPRVEEVMALSREAEAGRGAMFRGGRGRGDPGAEGAGHGPLASSAVARAGDDLQRTLDNPEAAADQIAAKLAAFRSARKKAQQDLASAQQKLRQLVTDRQEAQLVLMGILD